MIFRRCRISIGGIEWGIILIVIDYSFVDLFYCFVFWDDYWD